MSLWNPIAHMVEGLRATMLGDASPLAPGVVMLAVTALATTAVAWRLLQIGYKMKA